MKKQWQFLTDEEVTKIYGAPCLRYMAGCAICDRWRRQRLLLAWEFEDIAAREDDKLWEDSEVVDEPESSVNLTDMLNDIRDKQSTEYRRARMLGLDLMLNRKIMKPKKPKKNKGKK